MVSNWPFIGTVLRKILRLFRLSWKKAIIMYPGMAVIPGKASRKTFFLSLHHFIYTHTYICIWLLHLMSMKCKVFWGLTISGSLGKIQLPREIRFFSIVKSDCGCQGHCGGEMWMMCSVFAIKELGSEAPPAERWEKQLGGCCWNPKWKWWGSALSARQ